MKRSKITICSLLVTAALTNMVVAERVTITRIDGTTLRCEWQSAEATSLVCVKDGASQSIALDDVQQVRFTRRPAPGRDEHVTEFFPAAGGQLLGLITESADVAVVADTALGDNVTIPFDKLAAVWFNRDTVQRSVRQQFDQLRRDRLPGKDVLVAIRDDNATTIKGGILSLNADGGRLIFNSKERTFNTETVPAVVFAIGLAEQPSWPMTATLTDGTVMPGRLTSADADNLAFETAIGPTVTLPLYRVRTLRFTSPRVVYLSDLSPSDIEMDAMLLEMVPPRFDRSAANTPITLDDQVYEKGIGTHARTELRYALDQPYDTFAAVIGIDDSVKPNGHVQYRLLGDGKTLYESASITGSDQALSIAVDIKGVKELTLVTDFGELLDVSDLANWADARLIKPTEVTP